MYKLIRPLLFNFDEERVHDALARGMTMVSQPLVLKLLAKFYEFEHSLLYTNVFGIDFANPVGLAAGYDKRGARVDFLASLGFGFIEVGTVTPRAQLGNPKPRLFHLQKEEALLNRMGFNNEGAETLEIRLKRRASSVILGVNIGKNKETSNEKALSDYLACFEKFAPLANYIAVNVSSPNTPGLRNLQTKSFLRELLARLQKPTPVFIKIAPELSVFQLDDIIGEIEQRPYTGIIATNTFKQERSGIGEGGVSGKPLAKRSCEVIRYIFDQSHGKIPIIGLGGIFCAEDAYEKIRAGASLVQLYTGLIYEGPGLVKKIKKGLVRLLARDGFPSVAEAVGKH